MPKGSRQAPLRSQALAAAAEARATGPTASTVVAFRPRPRNTLGPRERIEATRWAMVAQPQGFTRIHIHEGDCEDPEIGDFLLIYETGREWASWGVARDGRGFVVWRPGTSETMGCYPVLRDALDAVLAQPSPPQGRATPKPRAGRPAERAVGRPTVLPVP